MTGSISRELKSSKEVASGPGVTQFEHTSTSRPQGPGGGRSRVEMTTSRAPDTIYGAVIRIIYVYMSGMALRPFCTSEPHITLWSGCYSESRFSTQAWRSLAMNRGRLREVDMKFLLQTSAPETVKQHPGLLAGREEDTAGGLHLWTPLRAFSTHRALLLAEEPPQGFSLKLFKVLSAHEYIWMANPEQGFDPGISDSVHYENKRCGLKPRCSHQGAGSSHGSNRPKRRKDQQTRVFFLSASAYQHRLRRSADLGWGYCLCHWRLRDFKRIALTLWASASPLKNGADCTLPGMSRYKAHA